jgi:hypothetical protein
LINVHDPVVENRPLQEQYYNTQSAEPVTVMAAIILGITAAGLAFKQ